MEENKVAIEENEAEVAIVRARTERKEKPSPSVHVKGKASIKSLIKTASLQRGL